MDNPQQHLKDIKQMMERSSRFISLSGWSGVAAGLCALTGAAFAYGSLVKEPVAKSIRNSYGERGVFYHSVWGMLADRLFLIAAATFTAAFLLAFVFTYARSKRAGLNVWGPSARRLMINVSIPMLSGGVFLLHLLQAGAFGLIAPGCLIFYGLALVNAGKYSLEEIRYLGYCQLLLGLINCWFIGYGLYFWAAGFGILHIVYGVLMWWKYERVQ